MAEIINKEYKKVREYDFVCPHCGAMSRFKKYELSFYEDCDDFPMVEFQCPNCRNRTHFLESKIEKYDLYKTNEEFAQRLGETIEKATDDFNKGASCLASFLTFLTFGAIALFIWICNLLK